MRDGRGGYCYEHNLLFKHALEALGFGVKGLLARVLWSAPKGAITPRSHMVLQVDLDGEPYIVDVGFGGVTLTGPLRLIADIEQATPHEPFRLRRVDDEFIEEVKIRDAWIPLYRFSLQEAFLSDYEVNNWYTATHPDNLFVNELLAARPVSDRRYALRNNQFTVHHLNGKTERRILMDVDEMREILEGPFGLTLPDVPELEAALKRLATSS